MSTLALLAQAAEPITSGDASLGFPVLPAMVFLPLLAAIAILFVPNSRPDMHRLLAIVAAVGTGVIGVYVLWNFTVGDPGYQFVSEVTWISSLDIKFALGIDGISLFLVVLTGVIFPLAVFAAKPEHSEKGYYFWLTLLMAGCMGVFLSLDLLLFFLFFEITLVPLYMLIGKWGHGRRVYAATKFFLFTMLGSMLMLVAIVALAYYAKAGAGGAISFDLRKVILSKELSQNLGRWLFLGFAVAFAVKTPMFPLHTWLPDAHTEAPTAGSVDLAGILLKLGTYGFLRYGLFLFPEAAVYFAPFLIAIGVIGIVYGAVVAAMQKNLKRLVAYSSVSHMGYCIVGLFALNVQGIEGSILQMINHGIITGGLFILLGYLYSRRHTYEIDQLKGLQRGAPIFAGIFTLIMLASIGLPGLSGFIGEFLALLGVFLNNHAFAIIAASGAIFASLYLLWAYQRVFHGLPDSDNAAFGDLKLHEVLVMVPIIGLIVFIGLYPKPLLDRIEPSVKLTLAHVEESVPGWTSPGSQNGRDLNPAAIAKSERESHGGEPKTEGSGETKTSEGAAGPDEAPTTTTTTTVAPAGGR